MKTNTLLKIVSAILLASTIIACDPPAEENNRSVPPSTCAITAPAEDYFEYDAAQLAMEQLFDEGSPDTSLVLIPTDYYNAYIKALGLIYDATSIPQRDSVINLQLHCQVNQTHSILISTSGVPTWTNNWINNIIPTGNTTVDNAISDYNLSITEGPFASPNPWYIIESNQPINGIALSHIFETIPGVIHADPNTYYHFFSKLEGSFSGNVAHIIFYEGYGDCFAGCFGYHQWKFDVDVSTCTVSFAGYIP